MAALLFVVMIAVGAVVVLAGVIIAVVLLTRRNSKSAVAGADVYRSLMNGTPPPPTAESNPRLNELRQNLRVKLLYQEDKIDAAIALEREHDPNATLEQLMQKAIVRWERDNQ